MAMILWVVFLMATACFPSFAHAKQSSECTDPVQVFETDQATKPYIIIGKIYMFAEDDFNKGGCNLMKLAAQNGGEAIVQFEYSQLNYIDEKSAGNVRKRYSTSAYLLSGVVVRWAGKNENGLRSISKRSIIPIIGN